jgi:hypothetical protein
LICQLHANNHSQQALRKWPTVHLDALANIVLRCDKMFSRGESAR